MFPSAVKEKKTCVRFERALQFMCIKTEQLIERLTREQFPHKMLFVFLSRGQKWTRTHSRSEDSWEMGAGWKQEGKLHILLSSCQHGAHLSFENEDRLEPLVHSKLFLAAKTTSISCEEAHTISAIQKKQDPFHKVTPQTSRASPTRFSGHRWGQVTRVCPGMWQIPQVRAFLAAGGLFAVPSPVVFLPFFPPSPLPLNPPP